MIKTLIKNVDKKGDKKMIASVITILLCIAAVVMLTQPALMLYGGENNIIISLLEKLGIKNGVSGYELIKFEEGQNIYLTVAAVFIILTIAFAALTLFSSLINAFLKDKSKRNGVSCKIVAMLFFLCAVVAGVMLALYAIESGVSSQELNITFTIGWGMASTIGCSLLALIFAPSRTRSKK